MTTSQIRTNTEKIAELFEKIDELEGLKSQLTQPYWNELEAKASTQEYNMRIVNLEAEIQELWNNR